MWWEAILAPIFHIIDKVVPDATEAAKQKAELQRMAVQGELDNMKGEFQLALGQLDVNKAEASSGDKFTSRWRPFIGWVCGAAFASNFVILPIASWAIAIWAPAVHVPPPFDMSTMMPVLLGMLGLGSMRSWEKGKGVAK